MSERYMFREMQDFSANYVQVCVDELGISKLSVKVNSKYRSVFEVQKALGNVDGILRAFVDF